MHPSLLAPWLRTLQALDRWRLARIVKRHPGLTISPRANSNLAHAEFHLHPGARLEIGPDVQTERRVGALRITVESGAHVVIGGGTWLRTDLNPIRINAFEGARLEIAPDSFLNGCHLSAKKRLTLGRESMVGPGTRVFDSDQHDLDAETPESPAAVEIGEYTWVASDVTVLKGVRIGAHCVVGARSVVTRDLPDHSLAVGAPARRIGDVGDRTNVAVTLGRTSRHES